MKHGILEGITCVIFATEILVLFTGIWLSNRNKRK